MSVAASGVIAEGAERWYVARTRPHHEFTARSQLAAQGFPTFLPVFAKTTRHARQFRHKLSPLFPAYVFVRLDLQRDRWRKVNGTRGVSRMIMAGDRPAPVPVGVVEDLDSQTDGRGILTFEDDLQVGSRVQIAAGVFQGNLANLVKLTPTGRAQVLLTILSGDIVVSVDRKDLLPAG